MRFRMFHAPGKHPVLAFANAKSRTMFWDMARFPEYTRYIDDLKEAQRIKEVTAAALQKPSWLLVKKVPANKRPAGNTYSTIYNSGRGSGSSAMGGGGGSSSVIGGIDKESMVSASPDPDSTAAASITCDLGYNQKTLTEWAEMYDMTNSHGLIKPHKMVGVDGAFVGRQVAFSPEGEWCVVVGNANRALIYSRWPKDSTKASTPGA
jgi:polycomb protein EED